MSMLLMQAIRKILKRLLQCVFTAPGVHVQCADIVKTNHLNG